MHDVAAAWLMTGIAPSPFFVPLLQTASSLPMFVLAIPGGALADILDRRRLLVYALAGTIGAICLLGALTLGGRTSAWVLLGMTCLVGMGNGLCRPAADAITPEVVPPEDLAQAVSLDAVGLNLARAIGGALGGLLIGVVGPGGVFLLNAVCTLPLPVALLRWKRTSTLGSLPPESIGGAVKAGFRYVRHAPPLRAVLIRVAAFIIPGCGLWSLLPLLARAELHLNSVHYGLLVSFFGGGALAGAQAMPWVRARFGPNAVLAASALLLSGVLLSLACAQALMQASLTMACAGVAWLALLSTLNTALQRSIPSWVRARGAALYALVLMGGMTLGSAIWGVVATTKGTRFALAAASGATVAGLLLGLRHPLPGKPANLTPSHHWPTPSLGEGQAHPDRPAEVTVEYRIDSERAGDFKKEMTRLADIRRRDGATEWQLEVDPADPCHFIEIFRLESWAEHLRQHERVTVEDRTVEDVMRAYHRGPGGPVVTHRILQREGENT